MSYRSDRWCRRRPVQFLIGAVALAILVVQSAAVAAGQEVSPAIGTAPDPSLCQAEPRSTALLEDLMATPEAATAAAAVSGSPTPFVAPEGAPADQETIDAVTNTFLEQLACVNAGDFARVFAFVSDDLLAGLAAAGELEGVLALMQAAPVVLSEDDYARLVDVRDVVILPDGRVGAVLEALFPQESPDPGTAYAVFVVEGGRLLFDEFIEGIDDSADGE